MYKTHATDALLARWHRKRLLLDRLHLQQQRVREQQERLKEEVAAQIEAAERKLAELEGQQGAAAEAAAPDPELGEQPGAAAAAAAGAAGGEAAPAAGEPQAAGQDQPSGGSIAQAASSRLIPAGSQAGPGSGKLARSGSSHGEDGPPGGSMKQPAAAGTAAGTASTACGGWHFGLQSTSLVARHEQRAEKLKGRQEKLVQQVAETEAELAELQGKVEQAQRNAAEARPAPCFFATFHTAHAAAYAGRLNLNPLHERMMRCGGRWLESCMLWAAAQPGYVASVCLLHCILRSSAVLIFLDSFTAPAPQRHARPRAPQRQLVGAVPFVGGARRAAHARLCGRTRHAAVPYRHVCR